MALDLTGIKNVGDFYSPHYLEELLENDLKGLLERWRKAKDEQGSTPPPDRLRGVSKAFFAGKAEAATADSERERWLASRDAHARLIEALGYERTPSHIEHVDEGTAVPVIARETRDGTPYLWIIEGRFRTAEEPALDTKLLSEQLTEDGVPVMAILPEGSLEDLPDRIFAQTEPPRWVILLCGGEVILAERGKWGQGKYLGFDLDELLGRGERRALEAAAALLSRDALCPDDGVVLHDTLDENSHKHAYAVSEDLKFGVRNAVELLANEFVWYRRTVSKERLFGDDALAAKLKAESLRYLYRILFLLYAEARDEELDVLDMKSPEYRAGYSFESLRDLEQVPLATDRALNGYFLHESLEKLFRLVQEGHGYIAGAQTQQLALAAANPADDKVLDRGISIQALRAGLFDPARTPLFSSVKFRNCVLQEVIRNLSLSREAAKGLGGRKKQRGRISYAQLGINQLGAVYEGLLSFTGFFAEESLYEVRPAGTKDDDDTTQHYFIPESAIGDYTDDEFVTLEAPDGSLTRKVYLKGSFIFRLAGRDRQQSASYYTPEVLTRCVVKYSLKELLKDKTADEIVELTVCEPAMGSGAFLNEAVGQLADAYLERKQKELGRILPAADYPLARKRVMAHIALNNVYGVDLNPTATELATVSLWLNVIHPDLPAPWFGLRLAIGNSLIGARHRVFEAVHLTGGGKKSPKPDDLWLTHVPREIPLAEPVPENTVFHFLVGDNGMAKYESDKVLKDLAPDEIAAIKKWRKEFNAPYTKVEVTRLERLTAQTASLWQKALGDRVRAARRTGRHVPVWPSDNAGYSGGGDPDLERDILERSNGPYQRLKLVMDAWSALWFWPIRDAGLLPTRNEWLDVVEVLVAGRREEKAGQVTFDFLRDADEEARQLALAFVEEHGLVDVNDLCARKPWLDVAQRVANERRFHHWELAFGEVFAEHGGFDLMVGNPPWVNVEWVETDFLADFDPRIALRNASATVVANKRAALLDNPETLSSYLAAAGETVSLQSALATRQAYSLLEGMRTNLYKCFVPQGWSLGSKRGVIGLLHPDGIYDDPKGGTLREAAYPRLRTHFQLINELRLFGDPTNHVTYSVNVYGAQQNRTTRFDNISNLFHPSTIDDSYAHDGVGAVPGIKNRDDDFNWDLRGHRGRIVTIDEDALAIFARLYDEPGTPASRARLPVVHSGEVLAVLRRFAQQKRRLADLEYFSTQHWNETNAQNDGTIRRETRFPKDAGEWVLSGPHFYVANPLNKTPNEGCATNRDYSAIDLTSIPEDFLPRTNYVPDCTSAEYRVRTPKWNGHLITEFYRHVHREMVGPTAERTLISTVVPPGVAHVHTVVSIAAAPLLLVELSAMASSVVADFLMKTTGKGHISESLLAVLPLPDDPHVGTRARRALRLTCLTKPYSALWEDLWPKLGADAGFTSNDPRLQTWTDLSDTWTRDCALRTDLDRRQALLELDALAALSLGLTLDELLTIFRVQFPVLQRYEHENRYDRSGRLLPKEVLKIAEEQCIDTNAPGPGIRWTDPKMYPLMEREYLPPFTRHDREDDMAHAYRVFDERLATKGVA